MYNMCWLPPQEAPITSASARSLKPTYVETGHSKGSASPLPLSETSALAFCLNMLPIVQMSGFIAGVGGLPNHNKVSLQSSLTIAYHVWRHRCQQKKLAMVALQLFLKAFLALGHGHLLIQEQVLGVQSGAHLSYWRLNLDYGHLLILLIRRRCYVLTLCKGTLLWQIGKSEEIQLNWDASTSKWVVPQPSESGCQIGR